MPNHTIISGETLAPKFAPFEIIHTSYKTVNNVPIPASIVIPKTLQPGTKAPVTIRWHGGGLGTGSRLFADWYGDWTLALTLRHNAIAVAPDYRLLPEATGVEILEDLRDFYPWLSSLASYLPDGIEPDLQSGLLITGESAGGYLAIQSALLPSPPLIAAIISHYPMIDMRAPHFTEKYHKDLLTPPIPQLDPSILAKHIEGLKGGEVVTSRSGPEGDALVMSMIQQGSYQSFFGVDASLYPLERLDEVKAFPPMWILHGERDSLVPVEGTRKFEKAVRERLPDAKLLVTIHEGEEHGFDLHDAASEAAATLETGWVTEGLQFVEKYWPKNVA